MPTTTLKRGSKGPEVTTWQAWLKSRKIELNIDGDFGSNTEAATKLWQQRAGVPATGLVDDATLVAAKELGFAADIVKKPVNKPTSSTADIFEGSKIDRINQAHIVKLAPALQTKARAFIAAAKRDGVTIQIVQGLRSWAEQTILYNKGRTTPGPKVTNAKAGQSNHNFGTAFDAAPVINGSVSWDEKKFKNFGKWADEAGLSWGGRWKFLDLPHLEYTGTVTLSQMRQLYTEGGLSRVWARIK